MNISYRWLRDLIDVDLEPKKLGEKLTLIGLELDGMHRVGDDHVFDIEVTSNRGDCLSHYGVAREVSTFSNKEIHLPHTLTEKPESQSSGIVSIESPELCHRFTARIIKNVKIGPSPGWLIKRLEAIGERSINNVADITNYVMHELGQPMHAFDMAKLEGSCLVVRRARPGEKITTLDEVERELDTSMLMICDTEKPVAVGGVMGGITSGITEETTDVLLEVAYFDRDSIRRTTRTLGLSSEASYHFERGVDINNLVRASNRATELICELAGGTADKFVDVYPNKFELIRIEAPDIKGEVERLSGLIVDDSEILRILEHLGLEQESETIFISPSWRHDLAIDEDLVEEVVRITGYDQVAEELPLAIAAGEYQPNETRKRKLRTALANMGFDEALSYSFIDAGTDGRFEILPNLLDSTLEEKFEAIRDPIIEGATRMRPTLLSGLLDAARVNFNHQNKNLKLFEIGTVFAKTRSESNLPKEQELMGIIISGDETYQNKALTSHSLDFYDLKGSLETAVTAIGSRPLSYVPTKAVHLQPGQAAEVLLGGRTVGLLGRINDEIASAYKFKQPVFVAEIDLEYVLNSDREPRSYFPLPVFPAIRRDVSLLIKKKVSFDDLVQEIESLGYELCESIRFVDVFDGKGMADDERSITIRLEYRSRERTLTEEEVEEVHEAILDSLRVNLAVKQR